MRVNNFVSRLLACVAIMTLATVANADVWDEIGDGGGDAGAFPGGSFQTQSSSTVFDSITGNNLDGIDSYLITVTDAATFYIEDLGGNDTQAFVWGTDGSALYANDDNAGPNATGFSFGFGNPGSSHLGNVIGSPTPLSDGDEIILSVGAFGDVATGSGGTGDAFLDDGGDFEALRAPSGEAFAGYAAGGAGDYNISLTGAQFGSAKTIPEPTTFGLFGLVGLTALSRRRR